MRQKVASDQAVARIAARQHGVISAQQLLAVGVTQSGIARRVKAGRLHRLHRGVYAVGHLAVPFRGACMAATLASGGIRAADAAVVLDYWGVAVSHRSAAVLWGLLPDAGGPIDVSIPGDHGRAKRGGIRVHRCPSLSPADVTLHRGIPVTKPARTISDLQRATAASAPGAVTPKDLRRAIRQANVLGLPIGEKLGRVRERSDLERDFLGICRRHRLSQPEVNVRIGSHLIDFLWRDRRLVVETDGYAYHRGRQAFEDDRARDLDLRSQGFAVIRLSEKQVDEEPERVAEALAAALRVGADG